MARYKSELGLTTPRFKRKEKKLREVITKLQDALMKANESLNDPDRVMQSRNDVINREGLKFWSGIDSEKAERLYGNKSTDMEFGALPKDIEKMAITYRSFINAAGNATAKWSEDGKLGTDPGNAYRQGANDLRDSAATMYNGKYIGQFPKVNAGSNSNPTPVNYTFPSADAEPGSIDTEEGLIAAVKASEGDQEKLVNMINESKAWDAFKNDKGASKKFVADLKAAVRGVTVNKETANASALATVDGKVNQLNNKGIGPEAENDNENTEIINNLDIGFKADLHKQRVKGINDMKSAFSNLISAVKTYAKDPTNQSVATAIATHLGKFIAGGVLSDGERTSVAGIKEDAAQAEDSFKKQFGIETGGVISPQQVTNMIEHAKGYVTKLVDKDVPIIRDALWNIGTKGREYTSETHKRAWRYLTGVINSNGIDVSALNAVKAAQDKKREKIIGKSLITKATDWFSRQSNEERPNITKAMKELSPGQPDLAALVAYYGKKVVRYPWTNSLKDIWAKVNKYDEGK